MRDSEVAGRLTRQTHAAIGIANTLHDSFTATLTTESTVFICSLLPEHHGV